MDIIIPCHLQAHSDTHLQRLQTEVKTSSGVIDILFDIFYLELIEYIIRQEKNNNYNKININNLRQTNKIDHSIQHQEESAKQSQGQQQRAEQHQKNIHQQTAEELDSQSWHQSRTLNMNINKISNSNANIKSQQESDNIAKTTRGSATMLTSGHIREVTTRSAS